MWAIALHPEYVKAFREGRKGIEVRTRIPRGLLSGDKLVVVETGSNGRVPIILRVDRIVKMSPAVLWQRYEPWMAIKAEDYEAYTKGKGQVVGLICNTIYWSKEGWRAEDFGINSTPQWFTGVAFMPESARKEVEA